MKKYIVASLIALQLFAPGFDKSWLGSIAIGATVIPSRFKDAVVSGALSVGATTVANSRAALDVGGTTKGILAPRLTLAQRDAITSPPNGLVIYNTTTNSLNIFNGTSWGSIGGGGGMADNVVQLSSIWEATKQDNVNADASVGDWVAFADAATAAPTGDLTGGSPNTTCLRTTTAGEILNGTGSFEMTLNSGASRQGEGCSVSVYVNPSNTGKDLYFSFPFQTSGALTSGDLTLAVYDVTAAALIQPEQIAYIATVSGGALARVAVPFSATGRQLRIALYVARTATTALSVQYDDVILAAKIAALGMAATNWQSFTPTGGWVANTTYTGKWRRVGDTLEMDVSVSLSGAPTGYLTLDLPTGYSIDTAKLSNFAGFPTAQAMGIWGGYDGAAFQGGTVTYNTATSVYLVGSTYTDAVSATVPVTWGNTDTINARIKVPVVGFDTNVTMASDPSAVPVVVQSTTSASTSVTAADTLLPFATEVSDSHGAWSSDAFTAPVAGDYIISANIAFSSAAFSNDNFVFLRLYKNAAYIKNIGEWAAQGANTVSPKVWGSGVVSLAKGDTLQIYANSSQTVALNGVADRNTVSISRITGASSAALDWPRSEVTVDTGNGHGSTNNKIRRFTNTIASRGTAITYADSAANGGSFTLNEAGVYSVTYSDYYTGGSAHMGVSLSSNQLTDSITDITATHRKCISGTPAANVMTSVSCKFNATIGDVVRAHTNGNPDGNNIYSAFTITKVSH